MLNSVRPAVSVHSYSWSLARHVSEISNLKKKIENFITVQRWIEIKNLFSICFVNLQCDTSTFQKRTAKAYYGHFVNPNQTYYLFIQFYRVLIIFRYISTIYTQEKLGLLKQNMK